MQVGDKIVFKYPENGWSFDQLNAKEFLKVGNEYTIKEIERGNWSTEIILDEVPDVVFNSVQFEGGENVRDC